MRSILLSLPLLASCSLLVAGLSPDLDPCGNGTTDEGEECDDGNSADQDGCNTLCQAPDPKDPLALCGNALTDQGEECDDGNDTDNDGCNSICGLPLCGNGLTDQIEACDDANAVEGDGCDSNCTVSACKNEIFVPGEICYVRKTFAVEIEGDPVSLAVKDFDADDILDIAMIVDRDVDAGGELVVRDVDILLGDGLGAFSAVQTFVFSDVNTELRNVIAEDIDNDGQIDLALTDGLTVAGTGKINILKKDKGGDFSEVTVVPLSDTEPELIAVGRFDNNSSLDIAIAHSISPILTGVLLRKTNNDGFLSELTTTLSNTFGLPDMVIGDFDADGRDDAIVTTFNSLDVLLNNGIGILLRSDPPLSLSGGTGFIASDDFDGDGSLDLVVSNRAISGGGGNVGRLNVLLGVGDGTFQQFGEALSLGNIIQDILTGDFSLDGVTDLAVLDGELNVVNILTGSGDGTFVIEEPFSVLENPTKIESGDFNKDGIPDFITIHPGIVGADNVSVLLSAP